MVFFVLFTVFAFEKKQFYYQFWLKSWNYGNFVAISSKKWLFWKISPKIGSFSKNIIKWKVMTQMFCNFFYKIWTECRYEKCPRTWFLVKNWSKYDYVKHAKIKNTLYIRRENLDDSGWYRQAVVSSRLSPLFGYNEQFGTE